MIYFAAFIVALLVTMVLIPPLMQMAGRLGLVDQPGHRKVHVSAVPRIGGVGMVLGVLLPVLLWSNLGREVISLITGMGILFVFGVWDDRGDLDYRLKFLGQFLAAIAIATYGGITISIVPFLGMDPVAGYISVPLTVLAIVAVTNSINLADGLDGLAAGLVILSLLGIALLSYLADGLNVLLLTLALAGAVMGFLRFNTYPARIFMGDTGSQFLGFCVATLSIMLTQQTNPALNPALPLLLIGVPLFDMAFVMIKRLYSGKSPFVADKNHIHHQLLALKFDHYEAVVTIYAVQALFVGGAILLRYNSDLLVVSSWLLANLLFALVLVIAGRRHWYVRHAGGISLVERVFRAGRNNRVFGASSMVITAALMLLFLACPFMVSDISMDFGVAALVLFILLLLRLVFGYRLWFVSLRLISYVTIAFIVFLYSKNRGDASGLQSLLEYLYFGLVVLALLVASRFTLKAAFRITPTDFLLMLVLIGLVFIPQAHVVEEDVIHLLIKMFVLFYAAEYALHSMRSRWSGLTVSMLFALGVIAMRGYLLS